MLRSATLGTNDHGCKLSQCVAVKECPPQYSPSVQLDVQDGIIPICRPPTKRSLHPDARPSDSTASVVLGCKVAVWNRMSKTGQQGQTSALPVLRSIHSAGSSLHQSTISWSIRQDCMWSDPKPPLKFELVRLEAYQRDSATVAIARNGGGCFGLRCCARSGMKYSMIYQIETEHQTMQPSPEWNRLLRPTKIFRIREHIGRSASGRRRTMKLLRIRQVVAATGVSRMTIHRLEKRGEFPRRVQLSRNSVAWHESAVNKWIASRPWATRTKGRLSQSCVRT